MKKLTTILCGMLMLMCSCIDDPDTNKENLGYNSSFPEPTYVTLDIKVVDESGTDVFDYCSLWSQLVYAEYKGQHYVCNPPFFVAATQRLTFATGDHALVFGRFYSDQNYDGEQIELHWIDGTVDVIKFTIWTVHDSYSGTSTVATRCYVNDVEMPFEDITLKKRRFIFDPMINDMDWAECPTADEPLVWNLNGNLLTNYTIEVANEGAVLEFECLTYNYLEETLTSLGDCSWAQCSVNGNKIIVTVDPFEASRQETRSCTLLTGVYFQSEKFEIIQKR